MSIGFFIYKKELGMNFTFNGASSSHGMAMITIQDEKIIVNGKVIGVTKAHFNEMVDKIEEYHQILLDNNLIEEEPTESEALEAATMLLAETREALSKTQKDLEDSQKISLELISRLEKLQEKEIKNAKSSTKKLSETKASVEVAQHNTDDYGADTTSFTDNAG